MIQIEKITDIKQHIGGLKAIIFDLDDTLYSEKEYIGSGFYAVAKRLSQVSEAEKKLWIAFNDKRPAIDEVLISEGIYSEELKQCCLEVYRQHDPNIHLYDGVLQMLVELRSRGYLLGIITDGRPEGQWKKINTLGLKEYIDHIIVTDELGGTKYRKPNKKAFVMMKKIFGIKYNEMCYVGDNIKKDLVSPEKLKMRSIYFNNKEGIYF